MPGTPCTYTSNAFVPGVTQRSIQIAETGKRAGGGAVENANVSTNDHCWAMAAPVMSRPEIVTTCVPGVSATRGVISTWSPSTDASAATSRSSMRTWSERGSIEAAPANRAEIDGYASWLCALGAVDTVTTSGGRAEPAPAPRRGRGLAGGGG